MEVKTRNFSTIVRRVKALTTFEEHFDKWLSYLKTSKLGYDEIKELFKLVGDSVTDGYFVDFPSDSETINPLLYALCLTGNKHRFFHDMPTLDKKYWIGTFRDAIDNYIDYETNGYIMGCFKDFYDTSEYEQYLIKNIKYKWFTPWHFNVHPHIMFLIREDNVNLFNDDQSKRRVKVDISEYFWIYVANKLYANLNQVIASFIAGDKNYCYDKEVADPICEYVKLGKITGQAAGWNPKLSGNTIKFLDAIKADPELYLYFSVK